ncbi:MAG TPA: carboxypeptidase-like regulatory domain-containing protein [Pyrinomonadaceae bacterium]|nr:carboxypeptidase-like regulatory domain-containing protein [Pyrinomonadaceae bacterium]
MSIAAQTLRTVLVTVGVCLVCAAGASTCLAQVTGELEKKAGSTIRGVVTYSDTGNPLRDAAIGIVNNETGMYEAGAVTDRRGRFVLKDVAAGRYLIHANAPGLLLPEAYNRNVGPVTTQLRPGSAKDIYTEVVVNGTDSVDVKVQALRGGVITGRVVSEDDQPVPRAEIKLLKRENDKWVPIDFTWRGASADPRLLMTDPSGSYRIAGLYSGDYIVRVSEPTTRFDRTDPADDAYNDGSFMVAYYPAATNIKQAQAVTVVEGSESSGIDIRLPDRVPRTISGTVTFGPNNEPGGFAEIVIERPDESGFRSDFDATIRADDDGKWVMRGIPAGEYDVKFGGSVRVDSPEGGGHIYVAPRKFRVTVSNEDVVLNVRLAVGATVAGTVKFGGPPPEDFYVLTPGLVVAKEGAVFPGNSTDSSARRGYVRDKGTFEIQHLAEGKYWFVLTGFKPDRYYVKSVTRKGVDLAQKPFTLTAGTVFADVVVTLATDVATIEGQLDFKPKTLPGEVIVTLAPANDATRRFSPGLLKAHPDAQGRFVFNCGPGEYLVAVPNGAQRRVTVSAGEKIKIRL